MVRLDRVTDAWVGRFRAMACPCEALVECEDASEARRVAEAIAACAWGVEQRFSRYLPGNGVDAINRSDGQPVTVDEETAKLLDFAASLHELSGGLFDITSGVLRRAWRFDGGGGVPEAGAIEALLPLVGWDKVDWHPPTLTLRPGMQIDFGGIGKEYAVDLAADLARQLTDASCVVNLGGDLAISHPRRDRRPWRVGVEAAAEGAREAASMVNLQAGALATSGDTHRFVLKNGRRYTHILDPRTGWPVENAPRSVTVAAATCTQAGMLTTLAMLKGSGAEAFLENERVRHWVQR